MCTVGRFAVQIGATLDSWPAVRTRSVSYFFSSARMHQRTGAWPCGLPFWVGRFR